MCNILLILLFNGFKNESFHHLEILPTGFKLSHRLILTPFRKSTGVQLGVKYLLLRALFLNLDPVDRLSYLYLEFFLCERFARLRGPRPIQLNLHMHVRRFVLLSNRYLLLLRIFEELASQLSIMFLENLVLSMFKVLCLLLLLVQLINMLDLLLDITCADNLV